MLHMIRVFSPISYKWPFSPRFFCVSRNISFWYLPNLNFMWLKTFKSYLFYFKFHSILSSGCWVFSFFLTLNKQIFLFTFPISTREAENRLYRFCCCSASELNTEWLLCCYSFSLLIFSDCTWMAFHQLPCVFTKSLEQLLVPFVDQFYPQSSQESP